MASRLAKNNIESFRLNPSTDDLFWTLVNKLHEQDEENKAKALPPPEASVDETFESQYDPSTFLGLHSGEVDLVGRFRRDGLAVSGFD